MRHLCNGLKSPTCLNTGPDILEELFVALTDMRVLVISYQLVQTTKERSAIEAQSRFESLLVVGLT